MTEQGGEQLVLDRAGRRRRRWTFALLAASLAIHLVAIALLPRHASPGQSSCPVLRLTVRKAQAAVEAAAVPAAEVMPKPPAEPQQLAYAAQPNDAALPSAVPKQPVQDAPAAEPRPASPLVPAETHAPAQSVEPRPASTAPIASAADGSERPKAGPAQEPSAGGSAEESPSQGPPAASPGTAPAGPEPKGSTADRPTVNVAALLKEYGQGVFASIKAQRYMPEEAERLGLEGTVRVWLMIDASGDLLNVKVESSSGHEAIDDAALEAVRRAAPFKALPVESGRSEAEFTFGLKYTLRSK